MKFQQKVIIFRITKIATKTCEISHEIFPEFQETPPQYRFLVYIFSRLGTEQLCREGKRQQQGMRIN